MSQQIRSNVELQALVHRQDALLDIYLKSLGALSTAIPSVSLLRDLLYPRNWTCPKMSMLEGYCALALHLNYLRNNLLQQTIAPAAANAALEDDLLHAFVTVRRMANALKDTKRFIKGIKSSDLVVRRAVIIGDALLGTARDVLRNSTTLVVFRSGGYQ